VRKFAVACLLLLTFSASAASRLPAAAKHGMVVSASEIASRVGRDVMKRGGNAVDAAIATAFALAVVWPEAGNIGGGGFMLIRNADGSLEAIDYRESAPLAATREMYLDAHGNVIPGESTKTYKAAGVPGTVAGLALAHKRHGRLPWRELVEPARKLAADGFVISDYLAERTNRKEHVERLSRYAESKQIFLKNGKLFTAGERLVQPELAATLARIAANPRDFYTGDIARRLVADMRANGGLVTREDLAQYKPVVRTPLRSSYRGYEVVTMPPPSGGGVALIEMFNMLDGFDLASMGWHSTQYVHTLVEVMRRAYADRSHYIGDPEFTKVPLRTLMSRAYADARRKTIDPVRATPSSDIGPGELAPYESQSTTHFVVVDKDGAAVSNTFTLNDSFGSGATAHGLGFLLNDEMDDFTSKLGAPNTWRLVQGERNAIAPKKRPLSSMSPVMVVKDGKLAYVAGSPGGGIIPNAVLQVLLNVIDFHMPLQQAVDAPRFHHQWMPDKLAWEDFEFTLDERATLEKLGYIFAAIHGPLSDPGEPNLGDVEIIAIGARTRVRFGAADPRRGGAAVGY
jgi:gamma-glutamyltranspeptidase/glutathione hydrolase